MLMGATTFRQMSEIVATGDDPTFPRMAELPKLVFSKTLKPPLTWANITVIDEPVETAVPALKAMADGLLMRTIGSPSLVHSFFRLGLVDRVQVMVFPTIRGVTGAGPVFAEAPDLDLHLTKTSVIDDRLVLLDIACPDFQNWPRPKQPRGLSGRAHGSQPRRPRRSRPDLDDSGRGGADPSSEMT